MKTTTPTTNAKIGMTNHAGIEVRVGDQVNAGTGKNACWCTVVGTLDAFYRSVLMSRNNEPLDHLAYERSELNHIDVIKDENNHDVNVWAVA